MTRHALGGCVKRGPFAAQREPYGHRVHGHRRNAAPLDRRSRIHERNFRAPRWVSTRKPSPNTRPIRMTQWPPAGSVAGEGSMLRLVGKLPGPLTLKKPTWLGKIGFSTAMARNEAPAT